MPVSPTRPVNQRGATPESVVRTVGASRADASRAAGGSLLGSAKSRQAVKRATEEVDHVPNPTPPASALATNSVGVVITELTTRLFGDPFFTPLLKGIYDALAERGLLLVILAPTSDRDLELVQTYLTEKHVDGVILVSLHDNNQIPKRLREHHIPTVIFGRPPRGVEASCIDIDNRQAGELAVNHLLSLGRKCIATISGDLDMSAAVDRLMGYRDALVAAGIPLDPTLEEVADYLPDRAHMAMERLLLNHPNVDAVFAASDPMAAAAVRVLQQARKRIPEDVAVIGFDDSSAAWESRPPLSSIRQRIEAMGREAVNVLMHEMSEPDELPRRVVFATQVVARESTIGATAAGVMSLASVPTR